MDSDKVLIPAGFLILLLFVGTGIFGVLHIGPYSQNGSVSHVESYPVGPEKPTPLNSTNVVDYTVTYEERLVYNDLLASHNHRLTADEKVIANCTGISSSKVATGEFRARLECRGGIADTPQLSEAEAFTYSATYRITDQTTQQTKLQNYPFETDRGFSSERT